MSSKMRKNIVVLASLMLFYSVQLVAQKGITTFGLQYKPIVPNRLIGTYSQEFNAEPFFSTVTQKIGHSYGMIVRTGLTKTVSLETGINFTQRNFNIDFAVPDSSYSAENDVRLIGYEIPLKGLVFIRLGEDLFMNTALGAVLNYFPSDVQVLDPIRLSEYFSFEGARRTRFAGSMVANIGFEYRTRRNGYFYFGSSYNLPFTQFYTFALSYEYLGGENLSIDNIRGSYLTIDLRYYFHEEKEKK
jgi:hypothetical protein